MADQGGRRDGAPRHLRTADRVFAGAENVVYGGIALLLVVTALVLLVRAAGQLLSIRDTPVQDVTIEVLDTLLLVFIVVELLFAVRATLVKRELVAEPFLLVGIIASIKEIVVLSVKASSCPFSAAMPPASRRRSRRSLGSFNRATAPSNFGVRTSRAARRATGFDRGWRSFRKIAGCSGR